MSSAPWLHFDHHDSLFRDPPLEEQRVAVGSLDHSPHATSTAEGVYALIKIRGAGPSSEAVERLATTLQDGEFAADTFHIVPSGQFVPVSLDPRVVGETVKTRMKPEHGSAAQGGWTPPPPRTSTTQQQEGGGQTTSSSSSASAPPAATTPAVELAKACLAEPSENDLSACFIANLEQAGDPAHLPDSVRERAQKVYAELRAFRAKAFATMHKGLARVPDMQKNRQDAEAEMLRLHEIHPEYQQNYLGPYIKALEESGIVPEDEGPFAWTLYLAVPEWEEERVYLNKTLKQARTNRQQRSADPSYQGLVA